MATECKVKRFRVVAGPNGSGKSSLYAALSETHRVPFYDFLNADDMECAARMDRVLPLKVALSNDVLIDFARLSGRKDDVVRPFLDGRIAVCGNAIVFHDRRAVTSYTLALIVDCLRHEYVRLGRNFSLETVFSHPSKILQLKDSFEAGYRNYLYYVATDDPRINVARVSERVLDGGHDVPKSKIVSRYGRSLNNVVAALPYLHRAYFFDNSNEMSLVASYSRDGGWVFYRHGDKALPRWFTHYVVDRFAVNVVAEFS